MANRDINLFKAAGGERAKGTKRSPTTYMLLLTLVVIVAAVGVLVFFNMRANNAENAYQAKETIKANYISTINNNKEASAVYKTVRDDIVAAAAINAYIDSASALYPPASESEILAVKSLITNLPTASYSVNEPEADEPFTPWDYDGLREALYAEGAPVVEDRELFYYGLQKLAEEQADAPEVNKWYTYFRGYLLVVFAGGDGMGLNSLVDTMISGGAAMDGSAPFSKFVMDNDLFVSGYFSPAKYFSMAYDVSDIETINFNVLLLPMKSVVERAFDILEAHSNALVEQNGWEGQLELASYGVDNIHFTNETMIFDLIIPSSASLTGYMSEFDASLYFEVANTVVRSEGEDLGSYVSHTITLGYKYIASAEEEE